MPTTPPDPKALRAALKAAFPDADVSDDLAAAMSAAMKQGTVQAEHGAPGPGAGLPFSEVDHAIRYYVAHAVHCRTGGTISTFEGYLPQARVRLPDTAGEEPIETALGLICDTDRKILSASQVKSLVGRTAARVELISAPRSPDATGARFGAIALYLCYERVDDKAPSFYILEGGTATGQPKVLFYGEALGAWIKNQHTAYQPTPFSGPSNYYNGVLRMRDDDPNEPATLTVEGRTSIDAEWYIQVSVTYHGSARPAAYNPLSLILEAAARVGVVGKALRVETDASIDVATMFLGRSLDWIVKPGA
jgi:hypothetical protein